MWYIFLKRGIWSCRVCIFHMKGLSIHLPIMALKAKCEEGVRRLQDLGQALWPLPRSSRKRRVCGKRQEKDWSLIKRSARLSWPCTLPGWWSGLLYIITCQKYKCNISAWMWQLQPEREKHCLDATRCQGAPGCSAWVILALFSTHILFQSSCQLVFVFILSHIGRMGLWHCQMYCHGLAGWPGVEGWAVAQLTPTWVKSWPLQGPTFMLEVPENCHSREK